MSSPTGKPRRARGEGSVTPYTTPAGGQRYRIQWREPRNFRFPHGPKRSAGKAGFLTEDEACLALKRRQVALTDGTATSSSGDKTTFNEYARRWFTGHPVGEGTRDYIERVINEAEPHIGHLRLHAIRPSDLAAFFRSLEAGIGRVSMKKGGGPLASSTVARYAGWIVTIFNAAIEDDLILKNPASSRRAERPRGAVAKRVKSIVVWTPDQTKQFCTWATVTNQHWADAYEILVRTGLRIGELSGLQWSDIDLARATLTVSRQVLSARRAGEKEQRIAPPERRTRADYPTR